MFNDPEFKDVALNQWLALTPPDLVRGHLDLDDIAMAAPESKCASRRPLISVLTPACA